LATLYITEFSGLGLDPSTRSAQVAAQPPVNEQTVSISGSSTASSAFKAATNMVRLHTDAICSIEFGTSPTASSTTARMAANQTEYFTVPKNLSYKVAVITNS
jgi:hypothetical protein